MINVVFLSIKFLISRQASVLVTYLTDYMIDEFFEKNYDNYKKKIKKVEVDVLMGDKSTHTYNMGDKAAKDDLSKYIELFVDYTTENIYDLFPKKNDAQIADAILELFRKREDIDIFNKKALYIYIREQVDAKTPKITKIANQLYDIFKENYVFYLEHGYTNF